VGRTTRHLPQGHSFHITLRCNSRQFLIAKRIRRDVLLVVLEKAKHKYPFRLYGVCLMANHIHLLIKPEDANQLPKLMHWVVRALLGGALLLHPHRPRRPPTGTQYPEIHSRQSKGSRGA
jgi:REP element-mobilizing transposase RayT